jgi:hypothetical protein
MGKLLYFVSSGQLTVVADVDGGYTPIFHQLA